MLRFFLCWMFCIAGATVLWSQTMSESSPQPASTDSSTVVESTSKPQIPPTPVVTPLSDSQAEMLQEQLRKLDAVKSPGELFEFIRSTYLTRNYLAAGLGMAFDETKYTTQAMRQQCLALWSDIIVRIDEVYPQPFPVNGARLRKFYRTADYSYIELDFIKGGNGCWQLGPESIAKTDAIYEQVRDDPPLRGDWLSQNAPRWMHYMFWGLSYFKWSLLGLGFLVGLLVYFIVQWGLHFIAGAYVHVFYRDVTTMSRKLWKWIAAICMIYVWFRTFAMLVLDPTLYDIAYVVFVTFATVMAIAVTMQLIDLLVAALRLRIMTKYSGAHVDNLIIPLLSRSLKTVAFCIGIISILQIFQWPILGVLSGMGIGGIAIAFAAKETVGNFFGSVTVLLDRPFEIGDWIVTDGVEGTVEAVGMRSTRIRTFYNSVITIPNNNLTTAVIDNMGRRRYRRLRTFLTLQYENGPDRIEAFCEGIKELILNNPFTLKENYFVCLYDLKPTSLDILLNVFFVCPSTETENRERAKLLGSILRLARDMDVRFAYPTQRLLMQRDGEAPFQSLPADTSTALGKIAAMRLLNPDIGIK